MFYQFRYRDVERRPEKIHPFAKRVLSKGVRGVGGISPGCLVDDRISVQLRVINDGFQGLDGLFEILNVPLVVVSATEEESVARRQKIVGNVLVDALPIGIWPTDENSLTAPDEIF